MFKNRVDLPLMKSPDETTTLLPNDKLYTYLSSQGPIKMSIE